MDVFLVGVAAEHELQLGGGDELADDVQDVVADDAFGGGEVADAHADDPALDVATISSSRHCSMSLLHRDVLRLPVVGLHRLVEVVGPLVFQREDVEEHGFPAVDHALAGIGEFGFLAVEDEGFVAQ